MRCLFPAKNRYVVNWLPERSTKTVEDCSHTQLLIFRVLTTNEQTNGFFSVHRLFSYQNPIFTKLVW